MVNEERVKKMARLEICAKQVGKEQFRISSYYRHDYVRLQELKTLIAITVSYIICLVGIAAVRIEYLLDHLPELDYKRIGMIAGGGYFVLLILFFLITRAMAVHKYNKAYKITYQYDHLLGELKNLYREDEKPEEERGEQKEDDGFTDF